MDGLTEWIMKLERLSGHNFTFSRKGKDIKAYSLPALTAEM